MSGVERFGMVVSWLVFMGTVLGAAFLELPDPDHTFNLAVVAIISGLAGLFLTNRWLDTRPAKSPPPVVKSHPPAASNNVEKQAQKYKRRGFFAVDKEIGDTETERNLRWFTGAGTIGSIIIGSNYIDEPFLKALFILPWIGWLLHLNHIHSAKVVAWRKKLTER